MSRFCFYLLWFHYFPADGIQAPLDAIDEHGTLSSFRLLEHIYILDCLK